MRLFTETGHISLNHVGEQLCGDRVEVIREDDRTLTMVLADGLGSGVKANILSTLTSKILCTMIAGGMPIEDCVETIAKTLPVCSVRQVAYSTFTILRITDAAHAELIQFDNPNVILLRGGKSAEYPIKSREISGKTVLESRVELKPHDVLVAMSDGAIFAGDRQTMNYGWQRDDIIAYLERLYDESFSAKMLAALVADECNQLYAGAPADDTTLAAVRIREASAVNLMMGPPADPRDAGRMMETFFAQEGAKVVCGGTTSQLAAEYLHEAVTTVQDRTADPAIPPIGRLKGVDLVTEGVVTMRRAVEYAKAFAENTDLMNLWNVQTDGASLIAQRLLEQATEARFFIGKAVNPAHQEPGLPIGFGVKIRLIQELAGYLEQLGKRVSIQYF